MDSIKLDTRTAKMIAHRGLSGIEKENTNAAFIAAGNRSYFGIETDVHKTVDGKFVIIHDDTTGRVAIDDLEVEKSTFETLRKLSLCDTDDKKGRADLHIPTLTEYISTCKRYGKTAVLELKNAFTSDEIAAICDEIMSCDYLENVIFISFVFDNLVKLREIIPESEAQFLVDSYSDDLPQLLAKYGFDLDIRYTELNAERIAAVHAVGAKVNCWTCNDKDRGEELCKWGVDFITSNILE